VPDELLVALLQDYFAEVGDKTILLDGYPRNVNQCKNLATMEDQYLVAAAVHLDVDLEEVKKRLANRALIEGRSDDTPEKIANRLGVYAQQTYPLLDYYKEQGKLLKVNGDQKPEAVFKDLLAVFQKEGLV
jgi:adenylate kinase